MASSIDEATAKLDAMIDAAGNGENVGEPSISEDELALRFAARYQDTLRHVPAWSAWLHWDGSKWARDEVLAVFDRARAICRVELDAHLLTGAALSDSRRDALRKSLGSAQTVYAVVRLAGSDPRMAVAVDRLDSNPWALNTPGGVVDLTTGQLRPHDPAEMHTMITAAAPDGDCPLWLATLKRVIPDAEARAYLQRLAGYALTGSSRDHVAPFWYGTGRNGKGTIAHTLRHAMGDYGLEIPAETLMETHGERHLTELAVLRGARLVIASEIDTNRHWNEARLKRLTGGDPISARYMRGDLFEFEPTHTLIVVANNKPGLRHVDEAIRSRMHMLSFGVTIPESERDATLPDRLVAEFGGILRWAVDGCIEWQRIGLAPPASVRLATAAYLGGEDHMAQWLAECCERVGRIRLSAAHKAYRSWCEKTGIQPLGRNQFADTLEAHDIQRNESEAKRGHVVFERLQLVQTEVRWYDDND